MSGRDDIRMHVEHLFEGRTLDAETIELKEEIYGNLVARFDDYVAQGMSAEEAYRRTCEAVTSIDDVLGANKSPAGEKSQGPEATRVAPVTGAPVPPGATEPETAGGGARRRWGAGKVALAVVAGLAVVGALSCAVFNVLRDPGAGRGASDAPGISRSADDAPADSAPSDDAGRTGVGRDAPSANYDDAPLIDTSGLVQEVRDHDPSVLLARAGAAWTEGGTELAEVMGTLPLGDYVSSAGSTGRSHGNGHGQGEAIPLVELAWTADERLARADDDAVERALAYDAMTLTCVFSNVDAVEFRIVEYDGEDGERDGDVYRFCRTDLERVLGAALSAERLSDGTWDDLREQVLTERICDALLDAAEQG